MNRGTSVIRVIVSASSKYASNESQDQKILDDLRDYSKGMINLTPEDLHLNEQQRVYAVSYTHL